jgi:HPt (histidine-containing phosphotransfer) domain-containing protein
MTVDINALNQLLDVIGGDHESLMELVDSFLADSRELLLAMTNGLETGDAPTIARSAHTMKSSARDFGMMELAEICLQLELKGKSGDLQDVADLVSRIDSQFTNGRDALINAVEGLSVNE